jgi:lipoprotein signal peptidase
LFGVTVRTQSKVILSLLPMLTWLCFAAWFEWRWHKVENPGAGYGFAAEFVYRHTLVAALTASTIIGVAFYAKRSRA